MKTKEYIEPHEATRIRVHHEGGGAWAIDAADDAGGMTEFNWNRDGHPDAKMARQRAIERAGEFAASIGLPPGLRIEVEAEPPAAAAARIAAAAPRMLEALKVMREAAERLEGWRDLDGTAIDSIIASDLMHEADCALRQAGSPWTRRHRVSVTVEVTLDTTPGEASDPGNVIMAAVEAVRDGEGVIVAHEIVK